MRLGRIPGFPISRIFAETPAFDRKIERFIPSELALTHFGAFRYSVLKSETCVWRPTIICG